MFRLQVTRRSFVTVTSEQADFDGVIYLRRDCLLPATELACNDDEGDTRHSGFSLVLEPGTYFVFIDGYDQGSQGLFGLEVTMTPEDRAGTAARLAREAAEIERANAEAEAERAAWAARVAAETQHAWAADEASDASHRGQPCPDSMLRIPGGTFWMGSPAGEGEDDEHPQHRVTLSAYCMDRTEVTVAAYQQCVMAGVCSPAPTTVNNSNFSAEDATFWSQFCNGSRGDRQDHPVNCVDWTQSDAFCRWRGLRLPTESEWEFAARGSDGRTYPWGNSAPDHTRLNALGSEATAVDLDRQYGRHWTASMYPGGDGWVSTAPVGSYPAGASPYGVLDMAGNVFEWTSDWYGPYVSGGSTNPRGPAAGEYRVRRGGGWAVDQPAWVRAASRHWSGPAVRVSDRGFRCARGA